MGTQKAANALINIINTVHRERHLGVLTPQQVTDYTNKVLAMSLLEVRAEFKRVNAATGFNRDTSDATAAQRKRIRELELGVYGKIRTTWQTPLTFEQAHDYLTELAQLRSQTVAGIRNVETYANDTPAGLTTSPAVSVLDT
jgi:hypothetical protein